MTGFRLEREIAHPLGQERSAPRPDRPGNFEARIWRANRDMLGNASSLFATSIMTSGLGFAFWALAARLFTAHAVGFGSAAISAMGVLATIGTFGFNTLLIGELPNRKARGGLIWAALLATGAGSLVIGLAFALMAPLASRNFADISDDPERLAVFVIGVTVVAVMMVFDDATIGLMRGGIQLCRNFIFVLVKLLLLPLAAWCLRDKFGAGITASWVAAAAISLGALAAHRLVARQWVFRRPDWGVLRGLGGLTLTHNWLNLVLSVPWMLLPVLVTITIGPDANAAYYAAWMVTSFLRIIPQSLSTVLFAVASGDEEALLPKLRFSLRASALIGIPGVIVLCFCAPLILDLFGASYARTGATSMVLLSLSYLPSITKYHYIAVCRATGNIVRAAAVLTGTGFLLIAAALCGGKMGGLTGFGIGVLAASTIEGIITAPRVISAAMGGRATRSPAPSISISDRP
jgi:O-antigen/teichoic acid export membrane protein